MIEGRGVGRLRPGGRLLTGRRRLTIGRIFVFAALVAASLAVSPASAAGVAAAVDDLTLTTSTTYTLLPARHLVHAVVDVTAVNDKSNRVSGGVVTRYFYDAFRIGVQPEARSIRATSAGSPLAVSTVAADGYLRVEVRLREPIFFHDTATVRVAFDLPGGAPRSKSEVRVGPAFATFVAWAFGDTGSVRIVVPAAFDTATTGSDLTKTVAGGSTVLTANVADVSSWFVVVNADRQSQLTDVAVRLRDGEQLRIRAWPDDPIWNRDVTDLLTRGLPELVDLIGLPWPVSGSITVSEVHTPLLEGYSGVFYAGRNRIEVSEDLDDLTIVHEASHAWFNGNLFRGRWIDEGFADAYAAEALARLDLGSWTPDDVAPTNRAAVKLNDWVAPGRISDAATDAREQFGYDASWTVIRSLVNEIGIERMRQVLAAASGGLIAYAGAGGPERVGGTADWRRLLDLVDEVGGSTKADGLFRTWVVSRNDLGLMDQRDAARARYQELVRRGGDWRPPLNVRAPLSDWTFPLATARIQAADALLTTRDTLTAEAAALGVTLPTAFRTAYETATTSLDPATAVADRELAELASLDRATAAVRSPHDALAALGLIGSDPEAALADARKAFSAGADDAPSRAAAVADLMAGAADSGRQRLLLAIVGADVLFGLVVIAVVARRRHRPRPAMAHRGPYATLADPSGADASDARTPEAPSAPEPSSATDPFAATDPVPATDPFVASDPPRTGDAS